MLTTVVGMPASDLDTPALLLDLDVLERNIATMASDVKSRGANWRPHAKASKTPALAHKEISAGAIGVAVAKVGEAEVMAANGVRDIMIANQVVGPIKTRRLAALCRHADVIASVDSLVNARELSAAASSAGSTIRVVVEVNSGMERCGVDPSATPELAREIASMPGLRFVGVMAWEGHAMAVADATERESAIRKAVGKLTGAADACRAVGLDVEIVSCGGSGTYLISAGIPGVTEVQAGGGIYGDELYRELGANVEPALSLTATVVSRPTPRRVIIDTGRKTIDPSARQPSIPDLPIAPPISFSAEHGVITLREPRDEPKVGDRLQMVIGYSDQLVHLHECFYGVRNGVVETVWPILGRGRLQ